MRIRRFFMALLLAAAPALAIAQQPDDDDVVALPEPAILALLGVGAVALVVTRRKKRK